MAKQKKTTQLEVKHEPAGTPAETPASTDMWAPLSALRQEIDRMFDEFNFGRWSRPDWKHGKLMPKGLWSSVPVADLVEDDEGYHLTMELPGLEPEDIQIKVTDSMISLSGEKTEEHKEEKKDYHLSERHYGSFKRSFSLPHGVNADTITASLAKGVLTLTMPKTAEAKKSERKIEVKAA